MLKKGNEMGPQGSVIPWQAKERLPRLEHNPLPGIGSLLTGVPAPQCSSYVAEGEGEDHLKMPQAQLIEMPQVMTPAHPSVRILLGSMDRETLDIVEQVYWGKYVLAPMNSLPGARKSTRWSYDRSWASTWLEQASGKDWHQLDPLPRAGDAPTATHPHRLGPLGQATGGKGSQMAKGGLIKEVVSIKRPMSLIQT